MNRRKILQSSLASSAALLAPELLAQSTARPAADAASGRPRLFFPPGRIADLRHRLATHASLQGKQNLYEHSWRVPFIVKGPGIKLGSRAKGNIYLLDVLATLCDIAGIPPPATSEGLSFKSVLEGRQDVVRDVLYGVFCGATKPGLRAVKHGDWKLIKYDFLDGTVRETQLFNLAENPAELIREHHEHHDPRVIALTGNRPARNQVNLAHDPRHAAKLQEMEALLLVEQRRHHDPYRLWNQPDDGLKPPALRPGACAQAEEIGDQARCVYWPVVGNAQRSTFNF